MTCKLCGQALERNRGSKFWHCTGLNMGHRGLVPDHMIPRYRGTDGQLYRYRRQAGATATKLEALIF